MTLALRNILKHYKYIILKKQAARTKISGQKKWKRSEFKKDK